MSGSSYDARRYWDRRLEATWSLQGVGLEHFSAGYNRWLRLGARVTGVDIADSAVRRLRLQFPDATFERRDISEPDPDLPGGYDVVDAFDVLLHIVDDGRYRQAIGNVHALLRDGGYFVFTDSCARRRQEPMNHYVRRSLAEMEHVLADTGFEIVSRRPAFVPMLNPFDGSRRVRWLWRRASPYMKSEHTGALVGAALYAPELMLTRFRRTSPTTQIVVCRKRPR